MGSLCPGPWQGKPGHASQQLGSAMSRLCVVIPALNEEATVADVIKKIPREIPGISDVCVVVVSDGSTDRTEELSLAAGAIVVRHPITYGVGRAFQTGVRKALELCADYMVNIDGDGQFDPSAIPELLAPLMSGDADCVSASRFKDKNYHPEMTTVKFYGNRLMSLLVSVLTGKKYYDVSCGFRAYTRDTLLHLNLFGDFTYTQESFLDLTFRKFRIVEVPVKVRGTREFGESRVASNLFAYAYRTASIITRTFRDYKPLRFFTALSFVIFVAGAGLFGFLMLHYIQTSSFSPHKWAGFCSAFLFIVSFMTFVVGLLADMLARNRRNEERILFLLRRQNSEMGGGGTCTMATSPSTGGKVQSGEFE